jgi:hypothetical protein
MTERPDEFAERDAVLNALRDLARAGLVHRHGPFAFATRYKRAGDLTWPTALSASARRLSGRRVSRCVPTR